MSKSTCLLLIIFALGLSVSLQAADVDSGKGDLRSEVLLRTVGMQRNYDRMNDFSAKIHYEFQHDGASELYDMHVKWAKPGLFLMEQLAIVPGATTNPGTTADPAATVGTFPLERRAFDGKDLTVAVKQPAGPEPSSTAEISRGTGGTRDLGSFAAMDPRAQIWGNEARPMWRYLYDLATAGKIKSVRKEKQFGADGIAIEVLPSAGKTEYLWVDDTHGSMPRIWRKHAGGDSLNIEIGGVKSSGGVWFPVQLMREMDISGSHSRATWRVESLEINRGIPAGQFKVDLKPGTYVSDHIHNRKYVVGKSETTSNVSTGTTIVVVIGVIAIVVLVTWRIVHKRRGPMLGTRRKT